MPFSAGHMVCAVPEMQEWLNEIGINAKTGRYSRYSAQVRSFYDIMEEGLLSSDIEEKFRVSSLALDEIHRLFYVYKAFYNERSEGFKRRLEKAVKGREYVDGTHDESRNYFFELNIAAIFRNAGFQICFDQTADVVAMNVTDKYIIECKKVNSSKKLIKLLGDASGQIKKSVDAQSDNMSGIVFLDISNCIIDKMQPYFSKPICSESVACTKIGNFLNYFLNEYAAKINNVNNIFSEYILGSVFFSQTQVWLSDVSLKTVRHFSLHIGSSLNEDRDRMFTNLFESQLKLNGN